MADYGLLKAPENMTPQAQELLDRYMQRQKDIDRDRLKGHLRAGLGATLEGVSALPVFNIPYVGTGLGGALFETGNAIMEGKKAGDVVKDAGKGFLIGEAVGFMPPAIQRLSKTKAGQAIGNKASNLFDYLTTTKAGQKVAEIAPKVEDVLMTDIKAFNPFKQSQIVYHGSPYDFVKFSNEAIGTGEGAQAHGMGHYVALDKNIADTRYRKNLTNRSYKVDGEIFNTDSSKYDFSPESLLGDAQYYGFENYVNKLNNNLRESDELVKTFDKLYTPAEIADDWHLDMKYTNAKQDLEKIPQYLDFFENLRGKKIEKNNGQLYKLSIPKDDVMLREDLPFSQQPEAVRKAMENIANTYNNTFDSDMLLQAINKNKKGKQFYRDLEFELGQDWKAAGEELYNNGIKGISYNGGTDGEARVIFNPDDIEIVRKYYNQPSLYDFLIKKAPNMGTVVSGLEK